MITEEYFNKIFEHIDSNIAENLNPANFSPLVLAYIGDAIYEVFVRTIVLSEGNAPVNRLHVKSISYVKAKAQADTLKELNEKLTPDEQNIVRRGRNAKSGTVPKNADLIEYKYATGFETLIGYLYLKKDFDRLLFIMKTAIANVKASR